MSKRLFETKETKQPSITLSELAKLENTQQTAIEEFDEEPTKEEKASFQIEKEHCLFVRIINFSQLKKAQEAFKQEQWGVVIPKTEENALSGRIRVRKNEDAQGKVSYELTIKNRTGDGQGSLETTVESIEEQFKQFKYMSDKGMIKHRYVFDAGNGKKWELDVAPNGDGGWHNWARLEIEVDNLEEALPRLPLEVEEVIMPEGKSKLSPEDWKEKTDKIMSKYFIKKNEFIKDDAPEQQQLAQESFEFVEDLIDAKNKTPLALEGFGSKIKAGLKRFITGEKEPKKEEVKGRDVKILAEEVYGSNPTGGMDKDKAIKIIKNVFEKEKKSLTFLFEFEGQLKFLKAKKIGDNFVDIPLNKLLELGAQIPTAREKNAAEQMKRVDAFINEVSGAKSAIDVTKMTLDFLNTFDDYQELLGRYEDQFISAYDNQIRDDASEEQLRSKEYSNFDWHYSDNISNDGKGNIQEALVSILKTFKK